VAKDSLPDDSDILEMAITVGAEEVKDGIDDEGHQCYQFICEPQVSISTALLSHHQCSCIVSMHAWLNLIGAYSAVQCRIGFL
jgi:hypothetical protein